MLSFLCKTDHIEKDGLIIMGRYTTLQITLERDDDNIGYQNKANDERAKIRTYPGNVRSESEYTNQQDSLVT